MDSGDVKAFWLKPREMVTTYTITITKSREKKGRGGDDDDATDDDDDGGGGLVVYLPPPSLVVWHPMVVVAAAARHCSILSGSGRDLQKIDEQP